MSRYHSGPAVLTPGDSPLGSEGAPISCRRSGNRPVPTTPLQRRCPCRVGSVFILAKETNGQFECVPDLSGRHISFLSGGFDRLLVALGHPLCSDHSAVDPSEGETDRSVLSHCQTQTHGAPSTSLQPVEARKSFRRVSDSPRETPDSRAATDALTGAIPQARGSGRAPNRSSGRSRSGTPRHCHVRSKKGPKTPPGMPGDNGRRRFQQVLCRRDDKHKTGSSESRFTDLFSSSAVAALASETIQWVSPGAEHLLVLTDRGKLYSCGENLFGCTGQGGTARGSVPHQVPALRESVVSSACAGGTFSVALTSDGGVYTWGGAFLGQSGRGLEEVALVPRFLQSLMRTPIRLVACNESHVLAVTRDGGQCLAWGSNDCCQLGIGRHCTVQYEPRLVLLSTARHPGVCGGGAFSPCGESQFERRDLGTESEAVQAETGEKSGFPRCIGDCEPAVVAQVAAGWRHSLALTIHGEVFAWGLNACGQLGLGHRKLVEVPTLVCEYERQLRSPRSCCPSPTRFTSAGSPLPVSSSLPASLLAEMPTAMSESGSHVSAAKSLAEKGEGRTRIASSKLGVFCADGPVVRSSQGSSGFNGSDISEERSELQRLQLRDCEHLSRVKQICAGRLFSGFLAEDGRVFVSGRLPSGREESIRRKLTKKEYVSEQDRQAIQANLVPTLVQGLGDLRSAEVACSNEAIIAFVPCQIQHVKPRLLPIPVPDAPLPTLRLRVSALPPAVQEAYEQAVLPRSDAAGEDADASYPEAEGEELHRWRESCTGGMSSAREMEGLGNLRTRMRALNQCGDDAVSPDSVSAIDFPKDESRYPPWEDESTEQCTAHLPKDTILVRFRPAAENWGGTGNPAAPRNESPQSPAALTQPRPSRLVTTIVTAEMEPRDDGPELKCRCPSVPEYSGVILPSRLKSGTVQSRCSAGYEQEAFPPPEFFDPEEDEEEERTRAFHMAKRIFEEESIQIFPHDVEVSIDSGCCWSGSEMAKTQARVLFANFPQRVERIMPNNVAINDFIPLGLPEDELVVKFTCVRQLPARSVGTSASDRHSDCLSVSKSPASSPPFTPRRSSYVPLRDAVESPPRRRAVSLSCTERESTASWAVLAPGLPHRHTVYASRPELVAAASAAHRKFWDGCQLSDFCGDEGGNMPLPTEAQFSFSVFAPAKVIAVEATSPKDESGREHAGKRAPETLAVQCISPALDEMVLEDFETFVDVALNGIHFTGQPHRLRVVDIKVMGVVPSVGSSDRATKVYIQASECFESDDTSVLLRYSDDTEEILPAHLDAATQQVYFFLPPQKALNHAAIGQVADDLPADNGSHRLTQWSGNMETQPGEKPRSIKNESSNSSELVTGTSQSGSASSCTPEGEALPSETDTTNQVSVFLSFNRQVFSQNAAIFTYYRSDLTTASVLAYTVSETGELFEADLEGTLAPQTHLVVYLQSGIATNSAKVRLTLLHPSPAASAFLASCAQDELLPNQAQSRALMPGGETVCQSPHGMTDGALGVATSADDAPEIPHEAVAKVIYLDADVVLNREPLMLLPDPSRTKKKTGVPRGGAGDGQRGKAGMPQGTKNKSGGKATTPGGGSAVAAGPAGNAGSERGEAKGGGGANNRDFGRGGVPSGGAGGATAKTKKSEKSDGTSPDNADENRNNSSLEVVTPSLSLPPLTPEEEQQAVPDDTVLAAFDISLDGQRFIRVKEARILRLQCVRPGAPVGGDVHPPSPEHPKGKKKATATGD